jgi:hypothetical protein
VRSGEVSQVWRQRAWRQRAWRQRACLRGGRGAVMALRVPPWGCVAQVPQVPRVLRPQVLDAPVLRVLLRAVRPALRVRLSLLLRVLLLRQRLRRKGLRRLLERGFSVLRS